MNNNTRAHESVDVNSLNSCLDLTSGIVKRIDKVREALKNFTTILSQIRLIIHNKTTTRQSLVRDVKVFFENVTNAEQKKFQAIQRIRASTDENSILSSANELSQVMAAATDVEKSMRRFARLIKQENYSQASLGTHVLQWVSKLVARWGDLDETYKSLRAELLATSKNYISIYESRTSGAAIMDTANEVLDAANKYTVNNNVMDTPPVMMRGSVPGMAQHAEVVKPQQQHAGMENLMQMAQPQVAKPKRKRKRKPKQPDQGQQGQQFDMNNLPPEILKQLLAAQQQQPAAQPVKRAPSPPPAPKKTPKYQMLTPGSEISYSSAWS
jgi:hypothetical protein